MAGGFVYHLQYRYYVTEQIDALEVMGVNSLNYLVFPKNCLANVSIFDWHQYVLGILGGWMAGSMADLLQCRIY
jgi:phospholipid/cholesterol/gamma-HCH transport system permease protein